MQISRVTYFILKIQKININSSQLELEYPSHIALLLFFFIRGTLINKISMLLKTREKKNINVARNNAA